MLRFPQAVALAVAASLPRRRDSGYNDADLESGARTNSKSDRRTAEGSPSRTNSRDDDDDDEQYSDAVQDVDADDEAENESEHHKEEHDVDDGERTLADTTPPSIRSPLRNCLSRIKHFVLQDHADEDIGYIPNYRWTPIVSGVIIPFSILLEIPGLTEHWYIRTVNNITVETRRNPVILDVGLSISMAFALFANIAIIVRFFEHRVKHMTVLAICALTLHDIINTTAVTIFGVEHRFNDGFTYGQSFWFTVCSTVASVFTNLTLCWDLYRTADFHKSGSGLTRKQRSLVIIIMILLCWIALGALIHSFLGKLTFIDGLYFTIVTIETIGFGDIVPTNTASRIFAAVHGTIGILNLALAVKTCRETIIESFEHSYRRRIKALKARRRERRAYRAQRRAKKVALKRQLQMAGLPLYVHPMQQHHPGGGRITHSHKLRLNIDALSLEQRHAASQEAASSIDEKGKNGSGSDLSLNIGTRGRTDTYTSEISVVSVDTASTDVSALGDHKDKDITYEHQKESVVKSTLVWVLFLTFWMTGAAIFMSTEGWSFGIALWFCFEAFSTIGYGEFTPKTPAGRSVFIVWALLGVGTMTILISVLSEAYSSRYDMAILSSASEKEKDKYKRQNRQNAVKAQMQQVLQQPQPALRAPARPPRTRASCPDFHSATPGSMFGETGPRVRYEDEEQPAMG